MFHSRLKWLSLVAICVSILVSSAAGQQTRRTPPPVPQSEQDTVNKIKELMRQIDALMGKLPPNIQNQLKTELDGPAGLPSRELPPGPPTRGLPPEQEAVKREILSLKGEMDELLSKLPKDTQAQLRQEMAQPPESPQPPEGPHPGGRPPGPSPFGGTQQAPPRPGVQPGSQQQPGAPRPGGIQPGMPPSGPASPQFGRPQPGPRQPSGPTGPPLPGRGQPGAQRPLAEANKPQPGPGAPSGPQPGPQQPPPQQSDAQPYLSGQPALLIDGECKFVSSYSMGEILPGSDGAPPNTVEVGVGMIPDKLFRWIEDSVGPDGAATRSGEIHMIRTNDLQSMAVREFQNATISSVIFPALDFAPSNVPTRITVVFDPEELHHSGPGSTSCKPDWPGKKNPGLTSFRVTLDGLPTNHVSRIESFVWSRDPRTNAVTIPELELTISMIDYDVYSEYVNESIYSGNLGSQQELTGSLEFLAGDLMTVLATIELEGVTLVELLIPSMEANQQALAVFNVRLHANSMVFK